MLKKDIVGTFGANILRAILAMVGQVVLARALGTEMLGVYALAILLPRTITIFAQLGQGAVNPTFAGLYRDKRKALFAQTLLFSAVTSSLGMLGMAAWFFWLPFDLGKFAVLSTSAIAIGLLMIPAETLALLLRELARGTERILSTVFIFAAGTGLMALAFLVVLVFFNGGLIEALWITLLVPVFWILCHLWQIRELVTVNPRRLSWTLMKESLGFGGVVTVSTGAIFLVGQVGLFLLGYMDVTIAQIGLYSLAVRMSRQVQFVPTSVAQAFLPRLSNDPDARAGQTPMVFRITLLACMAAMLLLVVVGPPALYLLFGQQFVGSVVPFLIMLAGLAVFGAFRVLGMFLWVKKKPVYGMVNNWISLGATGGVSVVLIPWLGINGAAIGNAVGLCVLSALTAWAYHRESGVPYRELVPKKEDIQRVVAEMRGALQKVTRRGGAR